MAWLPRHSALIRAIYPDEWEWDLRAQLAALQIDETRWFAYQHAVGSPNLRKPTTPPKQVPRPGVEPDDKTYGGKDVLPIDEMAEWLGGRFASLNN